jgi:hypothetical protein
MTLQMDRQGGAGKIWLYKVSNGEQEANLPPVFVVVHMIYSVEIQE